MHPSPIPHPPSRVFGERRRLAHRAPGFCPSPPPGRRDPRAGGGREAARGAAPGRRGDVAGADGRGGGGDGAGRGSAARQTPERWGGGGTGGLGRAARQRFEKAGHGDQTTTHRIDGQQELFKRDHTKDRLGATFTEHGNRRLRPRPDPDLHPRDRVSHLASVGQLERPFLVRDYPEPFQYFARDALYLVQVGPGEFRMSRLDPETVAALKAHEKIVTEYRDAFRWLAE